MIATILLATIATKSLGVCIQVPPWNPTANITSPWIAYGTWDNAGYTHAAEYQRLSTNNAAAVNSVVDALYERVWIGKHGGNVACGNNTYGALQFGELPLSAWSSVPRPNREPGESVGYREAWDNNGARVITNSYRLLSADVQNYASKRLAHFSPTFSGAKLYELSEHSEPPLSESWQQNFPSQSDHMIEEWRDVFPVYGMLGEDGAIYRTNYHERTHLFNWLKDGADWAGSNDVHALEVALANLNYCQPTNLSDVGATWSNVYAATVGWDVTAAMMAKWTNNTYRLDWQKIGAANIMARDMEWTYHNTDNFTSYNGVKRTTSVSQSRLGNITALTVDIGTRTITTPLSADYNNITAITNVVDEDIIYADDFARVRNLRSVNNVDKTINATKSLSEYISSAEITSPIMAAAPAEWTDGDNIIILAVGSWAELANSITLDVISWSRSGSWQWETMSATITHSCFNGWADFSGGSVVARIQRDESCEICQNSDRPWATYPIYPNLWDAGYVERQHEYYLETMVAAKTNTDDVLSWDSLPISARAYRGYRMETDTTTTTGEYFSAWATANSNLCAAASARWEAIQGHAVDSPYWSTPSAEEWATMASLTLEASVGFIPYTYGGDPSIQLAINATVHGVGAGRTLTITSIQDSRSGETLPEIYSSYLIGHLNVGVGGHEVVTRQQNFLQIDAHLEEIVRTEWDFRNMCEPWD